eukprot:gene13293-biopygen20018
MPPAERCAAPRRISAHLLLEPGPPTATRPSPPSMIPPQNIVPGGGTAGCAPCDICARFFGEIVGHLLLILSSAFAPPSGPLRERAAGTCKWCGLRQKAVWLSRVSVSGVRTAQIPLIQDEKAGPPALSTCPGACAGGGGGDGNAARDSRDSAPETAQKFQDKAIVGSGQVGALPARRPKSAWMEGGGSPAFQRSLCGPLASNSRAQLEELRLAENTSQVGRN